MSELFSQKAGLMNPVCAPGMVPLYDKPHYAWVNHVGISNPPIQFC